MKVINTNKKYENIKNKNGITLIALIITTIFCYDEFIKSSNNKGFLLQKIYAIIKQFDS